MTQQNDDDLAPLPLEEGDEEIARIREERHRISEEFGHDLYRRESIRRS